MPNNYYTYINDITEKAIQNPEWFWSDDNTEIRQWFYNNGAEDQIKVIYDNTPNNIKQNINPKYLPSDIQAQTIEDKTRETINTAAPYVRNVIAGAAAAPFLLEARVTGKLGQLGSKFLNSNLMNVDNPIAWAKGLTKLYPKHASIINNTALYSQAGLLSYYGAKSTDNIIKGKNKDNPIGQVFDAIGIALPAMYPMNRLLLKFKKANHKNPNIKFDIDENMSKTANKGAQITVSELSKDLHENIIKEWTDFLKSEYYKKLVLNHYPNMSTDEYNKFLGTQLHNLNTVKIYTTPNEYGNLRGQYNPSSHHIILFKYNDDINNSSINHEIVHALLGDNKYLEEKIYKALNYSSNPKIIGNNTFDNGIKFNKNYNALTPASKRAVHEIIKEDELRARILPAQKVLYENKKNNISPSTPYEYINRIRYKWPADFNFLRKEADKNSLIKLINNVMGISTPIILDKKDK